VRGFVGLDDPFGNRIELVAGQQSLGRPVAFSRRSGITEFGHVCLDAPDVREAYRFWSTTFNAKVSDWIGDGACLMRIDPVHHKLAVFQADEPGLCHMNFQVAEIDDVFRNWHFLLDHGVTIEMGPGRHPQSTAVFHFLGPEGFTYEYSFGVRRIEDDAAWTPRYFDPDELGSIDMWLGAPSAPSPSPSAAAACPSAHREPGALMIYVSHTLPVNEPGQPLVTRDDLWRGLVAKAGNALPFVAAMARCEVLERHGENVFDRSISFRGQDFVERITLEEPHRVVFTRLSGPVLGTIANEIEGEGDDLSLRFSFALVVQGVEGGSPPSASTPTQ
jgi:catechol 2,3-dioxygenase-like lactoylglutathione lyase family enzyme